MTSARALALLLVMFVAVPASQAYSVLTHEEIIDLVWDSDIKPMLLARFPAATSDELIEAHSYAYGGSVIQDLGYYPFGSHYFSDLVHYVRTGQFVQQLILDSHDINEFAFALGALGHYTSDVVGHPAVNMAVAIEFPKLQAKYGKRVTYAQDKSAHLRTEFGFDMVQVAKKRYAPQSYHDFIGFKVSKPLLQQAFKETYGLEFDGVFSHPNLAIGSYRRSISKIIPEMTKVALASKKDELTHEIPNFNKRKFLYRLSRADYERDWGKDYDQPRGKDKFLAFILRIVPKVGPFRALAFKVPTPKTEDMYFKSINTTVDLYRKYLAQVRTASLNLEDADLDTGNPTKFGEYALADTTVSALLQDSAKNNFSGMDKALRNDILRYFSGAAQNNSAPTALPAKTSEALLQLKGISSPD